MLGTFSGKIPACKVQIPSLSEASTSEANSFVPVPCPRDCRATYTLTSATPAYTHLFETGLRAAHPSTPSLERATSLQARRWLASQEAHSGGDFSKVAFPVLIPATYIARTTGQSCSTIDSIEISCASIGCIGIS